MACIGLRLVGEHPDRFARVVAANTFLPTGDTPPGRGLPGLAAFSQEVETFPTGVIVNAGCTTDLSPEVIAAYDAPFPDETYKEGARQFPILVPITPDDPAVGGQPGGMGGARTFDKPFLTAFSDSDPITAGADRSCRRGSPGPGPAPHHHRRAAVTSSRRTGARSWPRGRRLRAHHLEPT